MYHSRHHISILRTAAIIIGLVANDFCMHDPDVVMHICVIESMVLSKGVDPTGTSRYPSTT